MSTKTKHSAKDLFGWLWRGYMHRQKGILALAILFMVVEGSMLGALSYMMRPMFDDVFVEGQSSAIWPVALTIFSIFVIRAFTAVGQKVSLKRVVEGASADIRLSLLEHLMRLDTSFHQSNPPGSLIERVQGDVQAIGQVWSSVVTGFARDAIALMWLFSVATLIDWQWTVAALVGIPILILPSLLAQGYVRRKTRVAREVAAKMSTRLDEVFHGINPIKLNALEPYQAERYRTLIDERVRAEVKAALGQATIPGLVDIMTGIGFVVVLVYGGTEIIAGEKTVGQFMAFFTAMALAFEPLRRLGAISGLVQTASASIERVKSILETEPTLLSPAQPKPVPQSAPRIAFTNVDLAYDDHPVLRGASFVAEAGQTTALVGASGAGKSTTFNLLSRLVEPQSGLITLDETPINQMNLTDLRGLFSVVTQDAALFDETVLENITLGKPANDETLTRVLDAAYVSDFLPRLANGILTEAGPRGSNLSGGQRQRVAIARALLRETPVLLLDEATSALDTQSEAKVQTALDELAKGRTTLVIAHRLSTVRNADKIVVMDKGQVVDEGTHDELIERGGLYSDLYKLQFKS